jgi:hypothetical protein
MTRRCSLEVRTRPLVSKVTGNFGIAAALVTEAESESLVALIVWASPGLMDTLGAVR